MTDSGKAGGKERSKKAGRPVIETSVLEPGQEGPPAPRQKSTDASRAASAETSEPLGKSEQESATSGSAMPPDADVAPAVPDNNMGNGVKAGQDSAAAMAPSSPDLSLVGAVPVTLTLNVGSKRMMISDILKLQQGAIVRFDRREHDPLDIRINGTLFARGEVVLVGENYGLRILEIL